MTEEELRRKLISVADSFYGYSVASGRYKEIIDLYNEHTPLAQGYKVKYTDAWCATFGSAVAIKAHMTDIIPTECSCPRQIALWQKLGRWCEADNYIPLPGDYIYYDWDDNSAYASTDNKGTPDHVGIVYEVEGNKLTIIEGNYKKSVAYRYINVNGRYIRGYGLPDYSKLASEEEDVNAMECIVKPRKIAIYINSGRKTKEQIKAELGCDELINGGLFNGNWTAAAQLKANGYVYAAEDWGLNCGIAWNGDKDNLTLSHTIRSHDNFIGCIGMVEMFEPVKMSYPAAMGGSRQRSAIGLMDDGYIWLYATKTSTTPERLQQIAVEKGCKYAIMLDGGASTQCIFPNGSVNSNTRPLVHNYICVWNEGTEIEPPNDSDICPYLEPVINVKRGTTGVNAKWVQWMLNKHGYKLDVDGNFGTKSVAALIEFQSRNGLDPDGVCGPATRTKLRVFDSVQSDTKCPYAEPASYIRYGSVGEGAKWVQWMLNDILHGGLVVDGIFGSKSETILRTFQKTFGLEVDGICGPATVAKLKEVAKK